MSWYEYQPFKWIIENLSTRQIVDLIVSITIISLLAGSYYVYLDTIQSIRNNPYFYPFLQNFSIFFVIILIIFLIFSREFIFKIGAL